MICLAGQLNRTSKEYICVKRHLELRWLHIVTKPEATAICCGKRMIIGKKCKVLYWFSKETNIEVLTLMMHLDTFHHSLKRLPKLQFHFLGWFALYIKRVPKCQK